MAMQEPEVQLKRYLYLCSENPRYCASKKNNIHFCQLSEIQSVFQLITTKKSKSIVDLVETVNKDPLCTRRETLLFVLAACARNVEDAVDKNYAYSAILNVCQSNEELFLFIKLSHMLNKNFSRGLRRIIRTYYLRNEPMILARILTDRKKYHGWSHIDIINQIHLKSADVAQEYLLKYALKGPEEAKMKYKDQLEKSHILKDINAKLDKIKDLQLCTDEQQAIALIKDNKDFELQQIPSKLQNSHLVWEALISNMEIPALLKKIPRLSKLGLLKNNTATLNKVVEVMSDAKKCHACKIHPSQVLIYLKNFERGRPVDPQKKLFFDSLETNAADADAPRTEPKKCSNKEARTSYNNPPKNNTIISAYHKLLQCSYRNVHSTGRRVMITVDARDKNMSRWCFECKEVIGWEAATITVLSFVKSEKDVTVAVFNDNSVILVPIEKGMNFNQVLQKLKETTGGPVLISKTIQWALENKKQIDVFINIIHSPGALTNIPQKSRNQEPPISVLKRYRKIMRLPNTKMITMSLASKALMLADGSPHILDICGFDHNVPRIIEACCKGVFQ